MTTAQEEQQALLDSISARIYEEFQKPTPNQATIKRWTKHRAQIQAIIDQANTPDDDLRKPPLPIRAPLPEYDPLAAAEHATTLYKDRQRTVRYILKLYEQRDALRRRVQLLADELARKDYTWLMIRIKQLEAATVQYELTVQRLTEERDALKQQLRNKRYGLHRVTAAR